MVLGCDVVTGIFTNMSLVWALVNRYKRPRYLEGCFDKRSWFSKGVYG